MAFSQSGAALSPGRKKRNLGVRIFPERVTRRPEDCGGTDGIAGASGGMFRLQLPVVLACTAPMAPICTRRTMLCIRLGPEGRSYGLAHGTGHGWADGGGVLLA